MATNGMGTATPATEAPLQQALAIGRALAANGIRFVHWKSNSHLAEALSGRTDIDIFADPAQREHVRATLRQQGCLEMLSQPWGRYPDVEDWLAMDAATGRFLHLHLHFALVTGLRRIKHLRLPWGEALLANSDHALDPVWPTPTAEMELMILIVRMWAKMPPAKRKGRLRLPAHIRAEFDWLRARAGTTRLAALVAQLLPGFDAAPVLALVAAERPSDADVLAVSRAVYGQLTAHYRMAWPAARLRATGLNLRAMTLKELRKLRPATVTGKTLAGRGLVVAFVGSDGSGKSTLTADTTRWLRYKLDVHGYYMGSGDGSTRLLDRLRHALKRRGKAKAKTTAKNTAKTEPGAGDDAPRARRRGFAERLLALRHLPAIRAKAADLRAARALAAGGSMVVLDRLPQAQVNGINDGPRLQEGNGFRWAAAAEMRRFAEAGTLAPDVVIKLLVTPEQAHARKPDHGFATLKRKADIVRGLSFPGSQLVEIDAGQPLDQVVLAVRNAIWRAMLKAAEEGAHGAPR